MRIYTSNLRRLVVSSASKLPPEPVLIRGLGSKKVQATSPNFVPSHARPTQKDKIGVHLLPFWGFQGVTLG